MYKPSPATTIIEGPNSKIKGIVRAKRIYDTVSPLNPLASVLQEEHFIVIYLSKGITLRFTWRRSYQ
jgi:hypothetical protein